MLRSPAYCALSLSGRRILDRLEIELADHGGTDNGKLPVTYDDFQRYGLHRQAIHPGIKETVALGFVEITEMGVAGSAEYRKPNLFRLTYRHSEGRAGDGSHEWMKIATDHEAAEIAKTARSEKASQKQLLRYGSRQKSVRKPYRKRKSISTESTTTAHSTETTTTIDISSVSMAQHQACKARPHGGAAASPALPSIKAYSRPDILQAGIAAKLGSDGWLILQGIDPAELEALMELESRNALDTPVMEAARLAYRRGAA